MYLKQISYSPFFRKVFDFLFLRSTFAVYDFPYIWIFVLHKGFAVMISCCPKFLFSALHREFGFMYPTKTWFSISSEAIKQIWFPVPNTDFCFFVLLFILLDFEYLVNIWFLLPHRCLNVLVSYIPRILWLVPLVPNWNLLWFSPLKFHNYIGLYNKNYFGFSDTTFLTSRLLYSLLITEDLQNPQFPVSSIGIIYPQPRENLTSCTLHNR